MYIFFEILQKYFIVNSLFVLLSFLFIISKDCIKLHLSVDYTLLDYFPVIGHLGDSQFFCVLNILMHTACFFFVILFLGQVPRSGTARSKNMNVFMDLDFQKDYTNLQCHNDTWVFPVPLQL